MNRKPLDLIVIASATAITITSVLFRFNVGPLGVVLGLPFVLFYPGYVLTEVIMPDRARNIPERLLFSVGLSVVVVVLGGLLLNLLPDGLQSETWAILLGVIIIVGCAWISRRRYRALPAEEQTSRWAVTAWQLCLGALIVLGMEGSFVFTAYGATNQPHPGFTQLWVLPGTIGSSGDTVRFGIKSMESVSMSYNLTVIENGTIIHQDNSITLNPNQVWESSVTFPAPSTKLRIKVFLYRTQDPNTIYRSVLLWLGGS
jgi:uncharacterized membrane protein